MIDSAQHEVYNRLRGKRTGERNVVPDIVEIADH